MSTATTHIETEKQLVPAMRFNEFDGKWDLKRLASSIEIVAGYAFKSTEMENTPSTYQIIKMSNVYKSKLQLDRSPSYWEKIDKKQAKFLLRKKDILLTLTGTVGKKDYGYSIVIPENNKFLLNQRLVYLRYIENVSDGDFINNLIKTSRFFYFFFNESKGGTGNQTNVGIEDLKNIKLSFPTFPEQQKIASFLSAVDEKIQQLTKKKALLEQYKKGVMQQLFSGQLRFKDENGNSYPDWEDKKLVEVAERVSVGLATSVTAYYTDKSDESIPIIRNLNIKNGYFDDSDMLYLKPEFSNLHLNKRVKKGDVISVHTGSNVALTCIVPDKYDMAQTFTTLIVTPKANVLLANYLNQLLASDYGNYQALRLVVGGGKGNLNTNDFKIYPVPLPKYEEQQKIATYLSCIDTKIEAVNNQITQTQTFKKGLLQQMFV
jgi:type I restriction enzyme S subunit